VTHEYLPIDPVALDYLRGILEPVPADARVVAAREASRSPELKRVGDRKPSGVTAREFVGGNAKAETVR
jgi:hypothetical protein